MNVFSVTKQIYGCGRSIDSAEIPVFVFPASAFPHLEVDTVTKVILRIFIQVAINSQKGFGSLKVIGLCF